MASRLRHLRARVLKAAFNAHTAIYEASDGRLGSLTGMPMLLLTVTGRKSGQPRSTPLVYFEADGAYVVVGSDGGARHDPQWWSNLQANPRGRVRAGRRVLDVEAHLAEGEERERLWAQGLGVNPAWARYQKTTERNLPVVVLEPTQS